MTTGRINQISVFFGVFCVPAACTDTGRVFLAEHHGRSQAREAAHKLTVGRRQGRSGRPRPFVIVAHVVGPPLSLLFT